MYIERDAILYLIMMTHSASHITLNELDLALDWSLQSRPIAYTAISTVA